MYDAVVGRMLSPDNYVQDPTNSQNYNRYSYCLNNPLKYNDPTGWIHQLMKVAKAAFAEQANGVEGLSEWMSSGGGGTGGGVGMHIVTSISTSSANVQQYAGLNGYGGQWVTVGQVGVKNIDSHYEFNSYRNDGTQFWSYRGGIDWSRAEANDGDGYGNTFWQRFKNLPKAIWKGDIHKKNPNQTDFSVECNPGYGLITGATEKKAIYEVYHLVSTNPATLGKIEYVGITMKGMLNRFAQHLADPNKKFWISEVKPILVEGGVGLTKVEARILEQKEILRLGLSQLKNKINSIATKYFIKYGIP